jgi:DNA-binding NtrC family response regulator
VFRAVVLAESDTIGVEEFPQVAAQVATPLVPSAVPPAAPPAVVEVPQLMDIGPSTAPGFSPSATAAGSLSVLDNAGEVRALEEIEADTIRFAIAHYRGQMSEVARRLRIGRSTLYRKLEFLGLASKAVSNQNQDEPAEASNHDRN